MSVKINWRRVWARQDKWFEAKEGDSYPPTWEEQKENLQALVSRELKAQPRREGPRK